MKQENSNSNSNEFTDHLPCASKLLVIHLWKKQTEMRGAVYILAWEIESRHWMTEQRTCSNKIKKGRSDSFSEIQKLSRIQAIPLLVEGIRHSESQWKLKSRTFLKKKKLVNVWEKDVN